MRRSTLVAVTSLAVVVGVLTALPADATTTTAKSLLAKLSVRAETGSSTYARTAFRYPIDADQDSCDTREEVLLAESRVPARVGAGCAIRSGRWFSAYDGRTSTRPADVGVAHLVPLKEAWESGARRWTRAQRRLFANDLSYAWSLNVLSRDLQAAKGAADPGTWLPPRARCAYAKQWVAVKYRWRLTIDGAERDRLASILTGRCGARTLTLPRRMRVGPGPSPTPSTAAAVLTVPVSPVADTYVNSVLPTTNFGTSGSLAAYGSPEVYSMLRLVMPAAPAGRPLVRASLRVTTTTLDSAGSADTQQVRQVADTWAETTVTWNSRPAPSGPVLGSTAGAVAVATGYEIPLDAALVRPLLGTSISLGVLGTGTDSVWFASREWPTAAQRPVLLLQFGGAASADTAAPSSPSAVTAVVTGSSVALSWTASTDDVGVTKYEVHRSASAGFTPTAATLVGSATATSYADAARLAGTAYYRVVARDAAGNSSAPSNEAAATVAAGGSVTVMTVGDIACPPGSAVTARTCRHAEVAQVVTNSGAQHFIPLGDLQYNRGTYGEFMGAGAYDSAFRGLKSRTLPVVGNHEHVDPAGIAVGYFDYFYGSGVNAGPFGARPAGYYARTIGSWQFIALNSECIPDVHNGNLAVAGGCGVGSPQYQWLQSVLAASTARCTLVAMHRPRWSTGSHPPYQPMADMWDLMVRSGVDVTVAGHNHSSEAFQRIGVSGPGTTPVLDPNGIRSFVAGGGGSHLYSTTSGSTAATQALQARDFTTYGPLRLTLHESSFDWQFTPIPGQTFTNQGTSGAFSGTGESCR